MTRHFLKDDDLTSAEQLEILELAIELKKNRFSQKPFAGPQTVAVIFDKTSTRTRVSFAAGISDLGGVPLIIDSGSSQLGAKESVADTAKVLERMVAQIIWRTYAQSGLEEMAQNSSVPVINALSDDWHPCQLLADLLTIKEHFGKTQGLKLAYIGDANNNMANSYLVACALAGMDVSIAAPFGFRPQEAVVIRASEIAKEFGRNIEVFEKPEDAVMGAHVIATDTWVSMGMEHEKAARLETFANYTVDQALMDQAAEDVVFLHCLPAYRGYEVSAEVIDGPRSLVWDEAENRLHAQKALMLWLSRQA
ncbi:ornithine carbamoyltransferase [Candidatus Aquiluna sp. UB-MaderosW2red]|uniref:ornithine carbamoyltransferase n=1 Tax=Candidatus Aquiluna sp. UB-MaderosW2red TaxID=1855377 RepID=UPI000875CD88|nr:ornithine carbamoyltransferase [Candidatus Aquiluna sp. UB-MaderosW2red]SCX13104.1 ornithine carbamoyltransferase [Candidatus Aquiluna sp. UB-MaderosW2red]